MRRALQWIPKWRRRLNAATNRWDSGSRKVMLGMASATLAGLMFFAWLVGGPIGVVAYSIANSMSPSDYAATVTLVAPQQSLSFMDALAGTGTLEADPVVASNPDSLPPAAHASNAGGSRANLTGMTGPVAGSRTGRSSSGELSGRIGRLGIAIERWAAWENYADARDVLNGSAVDSLPAGSELQLRLDDFSVPFRWCPAGSFEWDATLSMAQSAALSVARNTAAITAAHPRVPVIITQGFAIMETECFQGLWSEVTGEERAWLPQQGPALPVHSVTQGEAASFAGRMQARLRIANALPQGWKLRLPYEAEWEYAMRAGGDSMYGAGVDSRNLFDHAWLAGNSGSQVRAVATRRPNAWGIHDGLGSVMEWCADRHTAQFLGGVDPRGTYEECWEWVYRGGAYGLDTRYSQLSYRHSGSDHVRGPMLGFRLVLVRDEND